MGQGNYMQDTIDLLEAIGRDASLRHASADELSRVLEQAQASPALTAAATSGDRAPLSVELGAKPNQAPQITQAPGHEDDEEQEEQEEQSSASARRSD